LIKRKQQRYVEWGYLMVNWEILVWEEWKVIIDSHCVHKRIQFASFSHGYLILHVRVMHY
jgi:hypothetical protein